MSSGILLGVFTGNHAGAEAPFNAGEYTVGAALDCDVSLTDSTLAPRHCSFLLTEDGAVRLTPLEGTLTLHGKNVSGSLDWPARTPVLAGMICLAWTRPGESWADMKLPSLLAAEEDSAEEKDEGQGPEKKTETVGKAPANPEGKGEDAVRSVGKRPGRFLRLILFAVIILGLLGLTITLHPSGKKSASGLKGLEQILSEGGFPELRVDENAGRAIIYGLVPTQVDVNAVRDIAAGQPYPIQVVVRAEEEFRQAVLRALEEKGLFPQVRFENGEAILLGYALDSLTENAALSWARGAAPRVASIRSALLTRKTVEETLTAELSKAGLGGKIVVEWQPGVIALSGEPADKNALTGVIEAVRGALDAPIAFRLAGSLEQKKNYPDEPAGNAGEPLAGTNHMPAPAGRDTPFDERFFLRSVTSVSGGGTGLPFITTSDGAVYFLGGTLPSGHTLTGIYADRLEFSRNGANVAYKLQGR